MAMVATKTLEASSAKTSSSQSTGVDTTLGSYGTHDRLISGKSAFYLDATAKTGTSPTLAVLIQDSADNTNWVTVATFTTLSDATGSERKEVLGPLRRYVRAKWTIGGSNTPGFTFSVTGAFTE